MDFFFCHPFPMVIPSKSQINRPIPLGVSHQVEQKAPPKLVQSLPRAHLGHPECLVPHGNGLLVTWQHGLKLMISNHFQKWFIMVHHCSSLDLKLDFFARHIQHMRNMCDLW